MKNKNVIIVTIDCLRKNYFDDFLKTKTWEIQFNDYDFSVFDNAHPTGSFTPTSMPGIAASRYAEYSEKNLYLPRDAELGYTILQEHGYKTAIIHANPYISKLFGYNEDVDFFEGFYIEKEYEETAVSHAVKKVRGSIIGDNALYRFLSRIYLGARLHLGSGALHPKIGCDKIFESAEKFVNENKKTNKFMWLHLMDLHGPLDDPENKTSIKDCNKLFIKASKRPREMSDKNVELLKGLYQKNLEKTLTGLYEFFEFLKKNDEFKESIIVITADHGEEFFENGEYGHRAKFLDCLVNVPLLVKVPGKGGGKKKGVCSTIDILPTIFEALDIKIPESYAGENLFNKRKKFAAIKNIYKEPLKEPVCLGDSGHKENYCIVFDDFKYVLENHKEQILPKTREDEKNLARARAAHRSCFRKKGVVDSIKIK